MPQVLPDRVPWYIVGPLLGLLVVGLYAIANRPLGASGAFVQTVTFFRLRPTAEPWRVWYFFGILGGAVLYTVLSGGAAVGWGYGALGQRVPLPVLIPVLFGAGVLMGYGARWAGGCTSGHGLCGSSTLSPASFAATASFMASAVAVTALLHLLTRGAL
jgi:uncharacterized membrane protein YedE/YeeE